MLTLTIPGMELFDEETNRFIPTTEVTVELEHSLVSLSKWEEIWAKPFLSDKEKTIVEMNSYVEQMCLTPNVHPSVFDRLNAEHYKEIGEYIEAKKTATWFNESRNPKTSTQVITSELVYYWMFSYQIPIECASWHLNRLLTLIKIFSVNSDATNKQKKFTSADLEERRRLNRERLAEAEKNQEKS